MTAAPAFSPPPVSAWGHVWRVGIVVFISAWAVAEDYARWWDGTRWRIALDVVVGAVALAVVWRYRRRMPFLVAVAVLGAPVAGGAALGPVVWSLVSATTTRRYWQVGALAATVLGIGTVATFFATLDEDEPRWAILTGLALMISAIFGWGLYIGSRRELLGTLHQRAERAEAERELRARQTRTDERARIAREMHDVLAHRISQISMHTGALVFREDLSADALRAGIADVHERANLALDDLRSVLGVLRDPDTGRAMDRPQPTYGDIAGLVAEARAAGARVDYVDRLGDEASEAKVPTALGRTLYRVVQEGITNANKHAPGARLMVGVSADDAGNDERGVRVVMSNPVGFGPSVTPGAGLGLIGLRERVELAGGQLSQGREGDLFVVRAVLPWPP
ncbi:MAG TPA: histidine kinase [Ilumatobacteraceae bacterium]|nr:histidine kinase [Ilumatobacteraceae bacterium]